MRRLLIVGALLLSSLPLATRAQSGPRAIGDGPAFQDAQSSYVLKVTAPPAKKSQKAVAHIKITPGAGYHMNKDYPTSLTFTAPAGLAVEKAKLTGKDAVRFEEQGAEFQVAYTASEVGKKVVSGEVKFAVCSADSCDPKKTKLSFEVDVK